jgi:catechol 2,3-dioxygenase-like lactoylglutathione lyase family enzyme
MNTPTSKVNSIQHIGVSVSNMDLSLPLYRKLFGLDIPFFDSIQAAPLMDVYTKNVTITKRASMVMNLQGGCAMEVIQPTSFVSRKNLNSFLLGDIGINYTIIKSKDIFKSRDIDLKHITTVSDVKARPDNRPAFYLTDPDENWFQVTSGDRWYTSNGHHSGGVTGVCIGVSDIDCSLKLYSAILGYNKVIYDESGCFEDFNCMPGGTNQFRRVLLSQDKTVGGGFAKVIGDTYIELIQVLDREPKKIFKGRMWGDQGFVHIGFDVKGMANLGDQLKDSGFPFTCDSSNSLNMGKTRVHCVYIDDPDGILLELIEVYRVPIIEKWGVFLNVERRNPMKPLPDFMLKALRFSRIKD